MMNLIREYDLRRQVKEWKLNTFFVSFYITLSFVLHLLSMHTGMVLGYPVLSGSLICCLMLVVINIVRSYSKANMVWWFILVSLFCNISAHSYILLIQSVPSTGILPALPIAEVISPRFFSIILVAEGSAILFFLVDFLMFSLLFHKVKINFFLSSYIATITSLITFTVFLVPTLLIHIYPYDALDLAINSFVVCAVTLVFYSMLGYFVASWIENKYLVKL